MSSVPQPRRPVGALVTLAFVVVLVGACQAARPGTAPLRPRPTPSPVAVSGASATDTSTAAAEAIVHASRARSFDSAVDGRGDLVTIWSDGYDYAKPTAWAILAVDGDRSTVLGDPGARVVATLPEGWLLSGTGGMVRLHRDGTTQSLAPPRGQTGVIRSGDVAYPGSHDSTALYRPSDGASYGIQRLLDQVHGRGAVITSGGVLVTLVRRAGTVEAARREQGRWNYARLGPGDPVSDGELAGHGQALIAVTTDHPAPLGDDAEDPLHTASVSQDGGRHWSTSVVPLGESVVLSMTVTRSGTGFISTGAGPCSLLRISEDETAACVDVRTIQVLAHQDRVYSTYFAARRVPYRFLVSSDQGHTWRRASVPGR